MAALGCVPTDDELVARLRRRGVVVELEPGPSDQIAADRDRGLLILCGKLHRAHSGFQFVERHLRLPLGVQEIADLAGVATAPAEGDIALLLCDRGKIEMGPAPL